MTTVSEVQNLQHRSIPLYQSIDQWLNHSSNHSQTIVIPKFIEADQELAAIAIQDSSMERVLPANSWIVVRPTADIKSADFAIITHEGSVLIRKYIQTKTLNIFEPLTYCEHEQPLIFLRDEPQPYNITAKVMSCFTFFNQS